MVFEVPPAGTSGSSSLTHRFLSDPATDAVFADEDALGEILWYMTDNQGTVRDVLDYDREDVEPGVWTETRTVIDHIEFGAFGEITAETDPSSRPVLVWTGIYRDPLTGMQLHWHRWYDPQTRRWLSNDPIGFLAGDTNLQRYVGNSPSNSTDPTGLVEQGPFWDGVLLAAEHYSIPSFLLQWAHDNKIDVSIGSPAYQSGFLGFNELYIPELEAGIFVKFGNAGKIFPGPIVPRPGALTQEAFHAWWDQDAEETELSSWIQDLMKAQPQFGADMLIKSEEAMSTLINYAIDEIATGGTIPTYAEIASATPGYWAQAICPGHFSKDEDWENDPGARRVMSEDLYYTTFWILEHGYRNPLPVVNPFDVLQRRPPFDNDKVLKWWASNYNNRLYWLKRYFVMRYRPDWNTAQVKEFLQSKPVPTPTFTVK